MANFYDNNDKNNQSLFDIFGNMYYNNRINICYGCDFLLLSSYSQLSYEKAFELFLDSFSPEGVFPFLLSLLTAVVCGAAIGVERTLRQKEAGIRTHIIVALGSALVMVVSKYGFTDIPNYDAARLAAQVVSGISFLGAGIIVYKGTVKGLTTAAGVWTTAGIGLAAGAEMYGIAIYSTIILLVVQIAIHKVVPVENTSTASISMKLVDDAEAVESVINTFNENGYSILSDSVEKKNEKFVCLFTVRTQNHVSPEELTKLFSNNDYVISVSV